MATQKRFIAENGLDNNSNTIPNVADPVNSQDVATKNYTTSNFLGSSSSAYPTMYPTLNLDFANSKQLDSRITFTRNSIATYYDGQTTALAEQNLLTYSQTFASPWAYIRSTVPASTIAAPDGTISGVLFTESSSAGTQFIAPFGGGLVTSVAGTYTYSVYGKNNGRYLTLAGNNGISNYISVIFDLSTGTYYQYQSGGQVINSVSCTQVGSTGWYRCVVTATFTASSGVNIASSDVTTVPTGGYGLPTYTGNGASGFYLWGAQLEQRSSVTAYTPTTTSAITNYIPVLMTASVNTPRFNCDPITGKSLGLLIEESRTNLATYSGAIGGTGWLGGTVTSTLNAAIAPDGSQTATQVIPTTSISNHHMEKSVNTTAGIAYTYSVYLKSAGYDRAAIWWSVGGLITVFDLSLGTIINSGVDSATITYIGNGWYRCTSTYTQPISNGTLMRVFFMQSGQTVVSSYAGNGYSGVLIWGAQLEVGSFPTSYIPTVASTVTRAIDAAVMTGTNFSSWYNQSQGTMYVESNSASSSVGAISVEFAASNGTTRGYIGNNINSGIARFSFTSTPNNIIGGTIVSGSTNKYVGSWVFGGNMSLTLNGSLIGTAVAPASPSYFNGVSTDYASMLAFYDINSGGGSNTLNGHIKKVMYYPVALSAPNLVALTT